MDENCHSDLKVIYSLQNSKEGTIKYENRYTKAEIEYNNNSYLLLIDDILEFDTSGRTFLFVSDEIKTNISATIIAHRNSIDTEKKLASRYSECKVYSFEDEDWTTFAAFYRSFLKAPKHFVYDISGMPYPIDLIVNGTPITLYQSDEYVIIQTETAIEHNAFSKIEYNILVALGFVSGKFLQDEVYTFRRTDKTSDIHTSFKYRKLRKGFSSIYHAVTGNSYSYEHLIGKSKAEGLYQMQTLKYLDANAISKLAELALINRQIQYALVLFNEANGNELSLLVKNNCFFAVMEVLKKYFFEVFKSQLPKNYSQKGNIEKFKMIFECIMPINDEEISTIEKRNVFMHGDIIDIEGAEMVSLMQRQITFIYRTLLTYAGFEGYIIDHYSIRNNQPEKAFIKLFKL